MIDRLVRLNERLAVLVTNATELATGMSRAHETDVDEHHDELVEAQRAERERADARLAEAHERLTAAQRAEAEIVEADEEPFREAWAEFVRLRDELRATRDPAERRRLRGEVAAAARAQIAARRARGEARTEARHAHAHSAGDVRRAEAAIEAALHDLAELDATAGYHTAAGGADRAEFQGAHERPVTGLLEHLDQAPPWASLRVGGDAAPTP